MDTTKPMYWKAWVQSSKDDKTVVTFFATPVHTSLDIARHIASLLLGGTDTEHIVIDEVSYAPQDVIHMVPGQLDTQFVQLVQSLLCALDDLETQACASKQSHQMGQAEIYQSQYDQLASLLAAFGKAIRPKHGHALILDGQRFIIYTDSVIGRRNI